MVEFFKLGLRDHLSRSIDRDAKGNVDSDSPAQEVPERKNVGEWPKDHYCDILIRNVAAICPCPQPEAKLKNSGLMELAGEISRQPNIEYHHVVSSNHSDAELQCKWD